MSDAGLEVKRNLSAQLSAIIQNKAQFSAALRPLVLFDKRPDQRDEYDFLCLLFLHLFCDLIIFY